MVQKWLIRAALWLCFAQVILGCCENKCSGHGNCNNGCTCTCHAQWTGADCSLRQCPSGLQWVGPASATDTLHTTSAVCSNAGKCNNNNGACECQDGFEGLACERLQCPLNCNNHGRCISIKDAAAEKDDLNFFRELTYSGWEGARIFGCQCEPGWTGYDCSLKECPKGDDPITTGQVNEVQEVTCTCGTNCAGSFYLSFRGQVTKAIPYNANAATIKAALDALKTITSVTVAFTADTQACSATPSVFTVEFTHEHGDVPTLRVSRNDLTADTTPSLSISTTTTGTKENDVCNGRGQCDYSTGLCTCESGFLSSDGEGAAGSLGDCGYAPTPTPTACPNSCSGHGDCDGNYRCSCYEGFLGHDCSLRQCPSGKAWFAEPGVSLAGLASISNGASSITTTADLTSSVFIGDTVFINGESLTVSAHVANTITVAETYTGATVANVEIYAHPDQAHMQVECSGRGVCNRAIGQCNCMQGFTGSACQKTECPSDCSGRGICISVAEFAEKTEENGDATSYTYGLDPSNRNTWDHDKLYGCKCDTSLLNNGLYDYTGHDCSLLACQKGDDPSTLGVDEEQTITCDATGGSFTLTFRQQTTSSISFGATATQVKAALEALSTVDSVSVSFDTGSAVCGSGSNVVTTIVFLTDHGNLPLMQLTSSLTGGTASVAETVAGTKEDVECSAHGLCDRETGVCECFSGYVSSDGMGSSGSRGDCSARDALSK